MTALRQSYGYAQAEPLGENNELGATGHAGVVGIPMTTQEALEDQLGPPGDLPSQRPNPFRHWLATLNLAIGAFLAGVLAAPVLAAVGWTSAATALYAAYHFACHQWAFRSFFLFGPAPVSSYTQQQLADQGIEPFGFIGSTDLGWKMAFCERDLAIYIGLLTVGILYARHRDLRPASFGLYALLILPMAIDGFTQLFGWRESTWELRVVTGLLFGLASGWLVLPRLDASFGLTRTAAQGRQYSPGERCQPVRPVAEPEPRLSPRG